jgi:hypothetical protein
MLQYRERASCDEQSNVCGVWSASEIKECNAIAVGFRYMRQHHIKKQRRELSSTGSTTIVGWRVNLVVSLSYSRLHRRLPSCIRIHLGILIFCATQFAMQAKRKNISLRIQYYVSCVSYFIDRSSFQSPFHWHIFTPSSWYIWYEINPACDAIEWDAWQVE